MSSKGSPKQGTENRWLPVAAHHGHMGNVALLQEDKVIIVHASFGEVNGRPWPSDDSSRLGMAGERPSNDHLTQPEAMDEPGTAL